MRLLIVVHGYAGQDALNDVRSFRSQADCPWISNCSPGMKETFSVRSRCVRNFAKRDTTCIAGWRMRAPR